MNHTTICYAMDFVKKLMSSPLKVRIMKVLLDRKLSPVQVSKKFKILVLIYLPTCFCDT